MAPSTLFLTNSKVYDREAIYIHTFVILGRQSLKKTHFSRWWLHFGLLFLSFPEIYRNQSTLDLRSRHTRTPTRSWVLANLCNTEFGFVSWQSVYSSNDVDGTVQKRYEEWLSMAVFKCFVFVIQFKAVAQKIVSLEQCDCTFLITNCTPAPFVGKFNFIVDLNEVKILSICFSITCHPFIKNFCCRTDYRANELVSI